MVFFRLSLLFVLMLFAFGMAGAPAQATPKNPGYARDKAVEMRSGDWYLLCDNLNNCSIRGVVKKLRRPALTRALLMIDRGAGQDEPWFVRLVFLDDAGREDADQPPPQKLRLYHVGRRSNLPPVAVDLDMLSGGLVHYVSSMQTIPFLAALSRNGRTIMREQGVDFASMPKGNLRKLLDRAEREQRTHIPQVDPEEEPNHPPRFDYDIFAAQPLPDAMPPGLVIPCADGFVRRSRAWKMVQQDQLWMVDCRTEVLVYQKLGVRPVEVLNLTDIDGRTFHPREANFDSSTGLMTMIVRQKGRSDCGYEISWGWTGGDGFALIKATRMPFCRNIPAAYWPTLSEAERWRIIGIYSDQSGTAGDPHPPMPNGGCAPEPEQQ